VAQCPCNDLPDPYLEYCHSEGVFWTGLGDVTIGGSNLCDIQYNALGVLGDPDTNADDQFPAYHYDRENHIWVRWPLNKHASRLDISDYDGFVWYSVNHPTSAAIAGIWKTPNTLAGTPEFEVSVACSTTAYGDVDTGEITAWWVAGGSLTTLNDVYNAALSISSAPTTCPSSAAIVLGLPTTFYTINAIAVDKDTERPLIALDNANSN
jgi:hypothetical protein